MTLILSYKYFSTSQIIFHRVLELLGQRIGFCVFLVSISQNHVNVNGHKAMATVQMSPKAFPKAFSGAAYHTSTKQTTWWHLFFSFLLSFLRDLSLGPRDAVLTAVGWKALRPPEPRGRSPGRRRRRHRGHQLRRGLENSRELHVSRRVSKGGIYAPYEQKLACW